MWLISQLRNPLGILMRKRIYCLLEILLILICSAGADTLSSKRKNEIGLTFSNIDPLGLCYNRSILGNKKVDLQLKSGFAFWIDPSIPELEHSVLFFTLNPDFEISIFEKKRFSISFVSGITCNYKLQIYKHGSTEDPAPDSTYFMHNTIQKTSNHFVVEASDTTFKPYKYLQRMYIVPNTGVQFSFLIVNRIKFQCTVGPRAEFTWILAPKPFLTKKFYWSDKISLGLSAGVYYIF
jgi:hypothetical protein